MKCEVIQDLLPLYHDECCSDESKRVVEEHLQNCPACRAVLQDIKTALPSVEQTAVPVCGKILLWKASILQAVLLFVSFGIVTVGVALEADTPTGFMNGFWAYTLVVPATGFLLSLANWFFIRLYKNRRRFLVGTVVVTVLFCLLAYGWSCLHYEVFAEGLGVGMRYLWVMFVMGSSSIVPVSFVLPILLVLSPVTANIYARWLGKE